MTIQTVNLGRQGLKVSRLGLGCMGMSDFYGGRDEGEAIKTLHKALELGVTFLDTADMYGPHKNELLLGKALKGRRDQVVLATKFGVQRFPEGNRINGRPEYVKSACDASLQRLGVDVIDLYYQHRVDKDVPIEDTVGAMAELVRAGKVRYLGLSEAAPATIRRAHAVHPISALQTEYSLWSRDPEDGLLQTTRELGIGFVAYSPLGRGFLTGRFKAPEDVPEGDNRRNHPRFQAANFAHNHALVDRLTEIAATKHATAAQLALAWVLRQGDAHSGDIVPIPGTTRTARLIENVGALAIRLTDSDLAALAAGVPKGGAAGQRYPDMSTVNR